jgi:hypothetical protein
MPKPKFVRPLLEALERRELLTTFYWRAPGGGNWSVLANWSTSPVNNVQPAAVPTINDTVVFDRSSGNGISRMNLPGAQLIPGTNRVGVPLGSLQMPDPDRVVGGTRGRGVLASRGASPLDSR